MGLEKAPVRTSVAIFLTIGFTGFFVQANLSRRVS
jgi:hypothetical protein